MSIFNEILQAYTSKNIKSVFYIGFFCGLPFLLTTGILDIWLKEYGVSKTVIGLFALLHCPYTLKFFWGPIFEKVPIPYISRKLGQYKSWAIVSQSILIISLVGIANSGPEDLYHTMLFATICALASGCQDMTLYTFLLNSAQKENLGIIATVMNFSFKVGMFIAKSSALYVAHYFSWKLAYLIMASSLLIGIAFVSSLSEPNKRMSKLDIKIYKLTEIFKKRRSENAKFLTKIELIFFECLFCPAKLFARNKNWYLYLLLIMLYRIGDFMIVKMGKIFYLEVGFTTLDIANAVQVFGTISSLLGGIIGGYIIKNSDIKKCMLFSSVLHAIVGLSLIILIYTGKNYYALYSIVFIEVTTGGAMNSCFLAFLYGLCNIGQKSTQFGLLWAFHEIAATVIRVLSGGYADVVGWQVFFITAALMFIPGIAIILVLIKREKEYGYKSV